MSLSETTEAFTMPLSWSLHATTEEIAGSQVRMAAVGAGDGDPGWEGEKFDAAVRFYGPSVMAHTMYLLLQKGMTRSEVLKAMRKELAELVEMD